MKEESLIIVIMIILIIFIGVLKFIRDFRIDHECYMMSDKEFYSSEQCKPYWEERK